MADDNSRQDQSILVGAQRLFQEGPKLLTGLAGVSGLAYLVGWIYTKSYFSEFGASWILNDISLATLFSYSWIPVLGLLFFAFLGITDLAELESKASQALSQRLKVSLGIYRYGRWIFLVLVSEDPVLSELGYDTAALILSGA